MGKMTFWGSLIGNGSKEVTRGGSASSGLTVEAASWNGRVVTRIYIDREGRESFVVTMCPHWSKSGQNTVLAEGLLNSEIAGDAFVVPALFA